MGSFNELERNEFVERRYVGKRVVYLESETDIQVFRERWFIDQGERVEFAPASDGEAGGCNEVINRVRAEREAKVDAWGVIDRDALAAKLQWDVFFEPDDEKFAEKGREFFGEFIVVLRNWEMENYLMHPEVIEAYIADAQGRSKRSNDAIVEELFDLICCKLPVVAANLLLNSYGKKPLPSNFGHKQGCTELLNQVEQRIESIGIPSEVLEECLAQIIAFGGEKRHRSVEHWLSLLRMLDGKLVIGWIKDRFGLKDECRFHWASRTRELGKLGQMIDEELWGLVMGSPVVVS